MPATSELDAQIEAVRRFNRFYTRRIGVLGEGHLQSPFSLTEVRVLYELAHRTEPTATELRRELGLDAGYLSRIVRGFEGRGLVERTQAAADARRQHLRLTDAGRGAFAELNSRASRDIAALVERLTQPERRRLVDALATAESLLGERKPPRVPFVLRPPHPGDLGWVVERHGALYAQEYGWDEHFEALVADIVARFVREHDAKRERCWIAEREGENVGAVFLVRKTDEVAQLRLLLVEPSARGLGIGKRLVSECTRFARRVGYRRIMLWTNSVLDAARHIYEQEGYRLVSEEPHHSFGHDLVGQNWELELRGAVV